MKERICCTCRKLGPVSDRIRVGRSKNVDGSYTYFIDERGNANGRGAYICKSCIPDAIKKRALNRSFKSQVPQEIYDQLS